MPQQKIYIYKNVNNKGILLNLQPFNLGKGSTSYTVTYINTV